MTTATCSSCWARNPEAEVPADADPDNVPGNSESSYVCDSDYPFVSGGTETCGCMEPYHGKVCDAERCCVAKYECYGNCGDLSALWIVLGCLGGALLLGFVSRAIYLDVRKKSTTIPTDITPGDKSSASSAGKEGDAGL